MPPSDPTPRSNSPQALPLLAALVAAGPVCYGVGLWTSATAATAVGAMVFLFVTPWLLGTVALARDPAKQATAGAWSLAVNSMALLLLCMALRITIGIDRTSFSVAWLAWTVTLALLTGGPGPCLDEIRLMGRRYGPGLLIGLATAIVAFLLFSPEYLENCFNGDGVEANDLARGMQDHTLPYWEVEEAARFGTFVSNPAWINSYWTFGLKVLLGTGELPVRLPVWIWWLGIFLAALRIVAPADEKMRWLPAVPLAGTLLLTALWYTFYVGYNPYTADPACSTYDALFALLILLALDCLRRGDASGWAVMTIMASLVRYAGPVMFVLMTAAALIWQPVPRQRMLQAAAAVVATLAAVVACYLFVGWQEGMLESWRNTFRGEYVHQYFSSAPRWWLNLLFVVYFVVGCGGLPVAALLRAFGKGNDRADAAWDRTVATVAFAYLLVILGSGIKALHYLGPLMPLAMILWLKRPLGQPGSRRGQVATSLLATASVAVCIALSWPASRPGFTLNRELGDATTFATDSYEEASLWGRLAWDLHDHRHLGWYVGQHTWATYSQLDATLDAPRPLVVSDRDPPSPDYRLVYRSPETGIGLYSRDPELTRWLAEQDPATGQQRYPWLLRPIAPRPRPR